MYNPLFALHRAKFANLLGRWNLFRIMEFSFFVFTVGYQLQELTCTIILESSQRPSQTYPTPIANSVDYFLNLDIKVRVVKSFNPVNPFSGNDSS